MKIKIRRILDSLSSLSYLFLFIAVLVVSIYIMRDHNIYKVFNDYGKFERGLVSYSKNIETYKTKKLVLENLNKKKNAIARLSSKKETIVDSKDMFSHIYKSTDTEPDAIINYLVYATPEEGGGYTTSPTPTGYIMASIESKSTSAMEKVLLELESINLSYVDFNLYKMVDEEKGELIVLDFVLGGVN